MIEFNDITLSELQVSLQIEKIKIGVYKINLLTPEKNHNISGVKDSFVLQDQLRFSQKSDQDTTNFTLFTNLIRKLRRLTVDYKDPRIIMMQLIKIQEEISRQYLAYKWIENTNCCDNDLEQFIKENGKIT